MQMVPFTPKKDVQDYLNSTFNYHLYKILTRSELGEKFGEPLNFFNLLYSRFQIVNDQVSRPLDIISDLAKLELPEITYFFLLDRLLALIFENNVTDFEKLGAPSVQEFPYQPLFAVHSIVVKKQIAKPNFLQKGQLKLLFLFDFIYEERSRVGSLANIDIPKIKPFIDSLEVEEVVELPKLKIKSGEKANIIRVFDALYELKLIETIDGHRPIKTQYMTLLGNFFGEDLSQYGPSRTMGLKAEEDTHLEIFDQLKKIAKSNWDKKNTK